MKRTIKIDLIGFWKDFSIETSNFGWCVFLRENYNIVYAKNPDYLFVNTMGPAYEFTRRKFKVSILVTRENLTPDFNLFDYAITAYPIKFLDRHFYYPQFFWTYYGFDNLISSFKKMTADDLKKKDLFANFIYSHNSRDGERLKIFNKLSKYKKVDAAGSYLNNQPNNYCVKMSDSSKTDFQKRCKFSICFESVNQPGFATEKITDAFSSRTIPIYCGSDVIYKVFNKKAVIDVSDFENYDAVVNKIKEIDSNDNEYLRIINEKPVLDDDYAKKFNDELCSFMRNIFEQPIDKAIRRSLYLMEEKHTRVIADAARYRFAIFVLNLPRRIIRKIRRTFAKSARNKNEDEK